MFSQPVVVFCSAGGSVCPGLRAALGGRLRAAAALGLLCSKKFCCSRLQCFFSLVFVTGIFVCRHHSWPDICRSLMGSICWIINAGVMYKDGLLQHGDHILG